MKTFLLTVALVAAVASAAPKNKRDVSHLLNGNSGYLPPNHAHQSHEHHHQPIQVVPHQTYGVPHVQPQASKQYLAPVAKQPLQLPSTNYGVPFKAAVVSAPAPVYHAPVVSAPAPVAPKTYIAPAPAPAPVPHQTYGVPVVHHVAAPVYQAPAPAPAPVAAAVPHQSYAAPAVHHVSAPVYQAPAPAPVPHQSYAAPVYHAPAPAPVAAAVPHQTYAAPVFQAPAPVVHHAPAYVAPAQDRVVFEAPVQSIELSQSHTFESVPMLPAPVQNVHHDSVSVESFAKGSADFHYAPQQTASNGGYVY